MLGESVEEVEGDGILFFLFFLFFLSSQERLLYRLFFLIKKQ